MEEWREKENMGEPDSGQKRDGADAERAAQEGAGRKRRGRVAKEIFSWMMVVVCAYALAFFVTRCVVLKAEVPTGSMLPTIQLEDRLIGNRLAYFFSDPARGDIIIFPFPDDEREIYIKRVIGLPGETVEIVDGILYIDGVLYEEDYLNEPMKGSFGAFTVPAGHYFVLGDNRNNSKDSRFWKNAYVAREKILAKAWFRYAPSWGLLK